MISKEIDGARVGISKSLATPCVEWAGARNDRGYGQTTVDGKVVYVHRLAWAEVNGPIPDGLYICHHCDNPPCYNAEHLFAGTNSENQRDAVRKGRKPHGENHRGHVLNDADVLAMRADYEIGNTLAIVALRYGVSVEAARKAISGVGWAHLPGAVAMRRRPVFRGDTNGNARLTRAQVADIRARYTGAWGEQTALGCEYGVSGTLIGYIVKAQVWP